MTTPVSLEAADVALARKDFSEYAAYVHNRPLFRHQADWAREMQMPQARTLIVAPPESYKSSTVRMYIEWYIGNDPDSATLYLMNTASQAQKQIMSVQDTIVSNPRYHAVFPHVVPDYKRGWTKEQLFIQRKNSSRPDATLYGTGIDGPYQGSHVDFLVVDDPSDQQDIRSEATMEQQRERLHGVLIDRLQENGSLIAILTRWGEADLVRDFREMGFVVIEQPLEGRYPWGRLLCPELFPDTRLRQIREQKGGALYALTYLCDPGAASGSMVKREWWRFYADVPAVPRHKRIHSWDLSIGKTATADYSAFTSWVVADDGFYLVDAGHWRLSPDERLSRMTLLAVRDDPGYVVVEESVPSMDFIDTLKKRTRLPLVLSRPGGKDKVARLQAVLPYIETGKVFLPGKAEWVNDFLDELAAFPGGRNDDWVDSVSMALAFMKKKSGRERGDSHEEHMPEGWRGYRRTRPIVGARW